MVGAVRVPSKAARYLRSGTLCLILAVGGCSQAVGQYTGPTASQPGSPVTLTAANHPVPPQPVTQRSKVFRVSEETIWEQYPDVPRGVLAAVMEAAEKTGADPAFMMAVAYKESRFNARAKNPTSSATGLYGFTTGTWLAAVREHGAKHGLRRYATGVDDEGRLIIRTAAQRRALLRLRTDARVASLMAGETLMAEERSVEQILVRKADHIDLYLTHFMGSGGAAKFFNGLKKNPNASVLRYAGAAAIGGNLQVLGGWEPRAIAKMTVRQSYEAMRRALHSRRDSYRSLVAFAENSSWPYTEIAEAP